MGLFPHSFKFQMDSLYISWQLSCSRKKIKRVPDKESVQGEEESGVPSGGGQNGKHFLFFLFLFSPPSLFPLTLVLNPELLKKTPRFCALSLEWFVIMLALLKWSLCIYRLSPGTAIHLFPRQLYYNKSTQPEREERREGSRGVWVQLQQKAVLYYSSSKDISIQFHKSVVKEKKKDTVTLFEWINFGDSRGTV